MIKPVSNACTLLHAVPNLNAQIRLKHVSSRTSAILARGIMFEKRVFFYILSAVDFTSRMLILNYSRTSRKRPPKMRKISVRLPWEVVA